MAVSITGTFTIIDRASSAMKKMETQAKKTMAAIEGVGSATDKSSSANTVRNLERTERTMRNVERQSKATHGGLRGLAGGMRDVDRQSGGLVSRLGRVATAFAGVRAIMLTIKFGAIAIGITSLVQAVGALAGGAVALVPALSSATGAIAAMPAVLAAAIQGISVFKLALSGVGDALKAGIAQQVNAGRAATDFADQQRSAANGVRAAERQLQMSHRATRDAQEQLTEARRSARRELVDQRLAAMGAALGERSAALALRRAKDALARGATDPMSTGLDMAEMQLGVRQARFNLRQSKVDTHRARNDADRAPQTARRRVRNAREGVEDAVYGQTEAMRALTEAQRQANRLMSDGTGDAQAYQQAMEQLPAPARAFVQRLVGLRDTWKSVQAAAAEGLFPGLDQALSDGLRGIPMLQRIVRRTGAVIGGGVAGITERMTTRDRLKDVEALAGSQDKLLGRMFRGFGNLTEALTDFMMAARPFTNWIGKTVEGWTEAAEAQAKFGRETGSTREKLERTRANLERFGRILSNLWGTFRGIGQAAAPLGERLWNGAERATEGWERFANSVEGQSKMREWFDSLYEPLHEMGQLTKDLAQAWARITVAPGFTRAIQILRQAVDPLERLMIRLSSMGPAAAGVLEQFVTLLSNLPFSPVELLLNALTGVLKVINRLLEAIPGLGTALSGLLLAGAIGKSIGLMSTLIGKWRMYVGLAAGGGLTGLGRRIGGGAPIIPVGGIGGAAGRAGTFASGRAAAIGAGSTFLGSKALGGLRGGLGNVVGRAGRAVSVARLAPMAAAGALGGGALRAGGTALRGAAKFALPLTALMGAFDFATAGGDVGNRAGSAANSATFGLFGKLTGFQDDIEQTTKRLSGLNERVEEFTGTNNSTGLRQVAEDFRTLARDGEQLDKVLKGGADSAESMARQLEEQAERVSDIRLGNELLGDFQKVAGVGGRSVGRLLRSFRFMAPDIRESTGQAMVAMAREMERKGILPLGSARKLMKRIGNTTDRLEQQGKTSTRRFVRGIAQTLARAIPGIGGLVSQLFTPKGGRAVDALTKGATGLSLRGLGARTFGGTPLGGLFEADSKSERREDSATVLHTQAQVAGVQGRFGLPRTGRVDPATQALLDSQNMVVDASARTNRSLDQIQQRHQRGQVRRNKVFAREMLEPVTISNSKLKSSALDVNAAVVRDTASKWPKIKDNIVNPTRQARTEAGTAFDGLLSDATKALVATGMTAPEASQLLKGGGGNPKDRPGPQGHALGGRISRYAGGGRIGGIGLNDTVPIAPGHMAAPGELIVNRHTENRIKSRYGVDLDSEVKGERRPHSAPMGRVKPFMSPAMGRSKQGKYINDALGGRISEYATGGRIVPIPGMPGESILSGILPSLMTLIRRFNLMVTDGFATGGHATNSDHYWGGAVDLVPGAGGSWEDVDRLAAWAEPTQNAPRPPFRWVGYNGDVNHGTGNHLHLSWMRDDFGLPGGVVPRMGAAGGDPIKLDRRQTALGGAPGAVAQASMDAYRKRLLKKANGGAGMDTSGMIGGLPEGVLTARQVARLAESVGMPGVTMAQIAKGESGFNPRAIGDDAAAGYGNTFGLGLWQITTGVGNDALIAKYGGREGMMDPYKNAMAAAELYKAGGVQPWYGTRYMTGTNLHFPQDAAALRGLKMGGRVPDWGGWNANGGSYDVRRPTLFGAGEAGDETVTITPKGQQGGSRRPIEVNVHVENYNRRGDIKKAVREELDEIADELEAMGAA